jgi:DNA-binding response OmpR family regulator
VSKHSTSSPLILVLEDEALIALDLQEGLQDSTYRVAGPFTTCAEALSWLQTETPDAAILDTVLKDGPCRDIARALAARDVPFLIYSGHSQDKALLPEFHDVRWIEKPVPPSVLIAECKRLLAFAA